MSDSKITIYRAERNDSDGWLIVSRLTAQDQRLSFEARGMLIYLLSKPSDWKVQIQELMTAGNCGRDRVYRVLRELEKFGYVAREAVCDDTRFAGIKYTVYEKPLTDFPLTAFPYTGNPPLQNIEKEQKKEKHSVRERTGGDAPKKLRQRDPIFDAVAEYLFQIEPEKVAGSSGGRIAQCSNWLIGKYTGNHRKVAACDPPASADEVRRFASTFTAQGLTPPQDYVKVSEHFAAWRARTEKRAAVGAKSVAPIELPELSAADYRRVDASGNWIGED